LSGFFSPQRMGTLAGIMALVMLVFDLSGYTWFRAQLTPTFALPLWTLFAADAGLQYLLWRHARNSLELSDREVAKWGSKLELATPLILDLYAERRPVREIAKKVEASHGIPPHVTLRYIIALARFSGGKTTPGNEAGS
jgi:hypothetical protein